MPARDGTRRSIVALLLILLAAIVVGVAAHAAGWPREQAIMSGVLLGTVLLWVTETLPLFATAFISVVSQMFLLGNPGRWPWLGFESGHNPTHPGIPVAGLVALLGIARTSLTP